MSDDESEMYIYTNLTLSDTEEIYSSQEAMEEGSPVAQAFVGIEGILSLQIEGGDMTIKREADVPWHTIVADISAALKDFFL